jgi:dihydropyrimidinase
VFEIVIRGGSVVDRRCIRRLDVGIAHGAVAAVEDHLEGKGAREIDASGKYVFPGAIDAHTHPVYLDGIKDLSITAAHGGITTLIHYAYAKPGNGLLDTIHRFREEGEATSVLDFGLHGGLFDPKAQSEEIPAAFELGVTSHKMFMTYAKLGWMTDDYQLMRTLDILGKTGGMGMVHAENGLATDYLEDRDLAEGRDAKEAFLDMRPAILEAEAIHRAIAMAQVAHCPLYIPHMTAALGIEEVARARNLGYRVYAETCPQYLTLTHEDLLRLGPLVKIGPPLRRESDRVALWRALADGTLDTIASDHAAKDKHPGDDFFDAPFGSPQAETMLRLAYDGGVNGGWFSVVRLVQVMSENPARIFGLYPKKGTLQVGSDADLVVFDPATGETIAHATQHSQAGYTAYEGRSILGRPVLTLQRGHVVLEDGALKTAPGGGRFLRTSSGSIDPNSLHQ